MSADSFGLSYPPGTTWPREWEICILWAFQKVSQPVGACLFLLPALLLSLSCQGGIAQKVGWGATQESDPLEKCVWGSGCFLAFLMCLPLAKASLGGGGSEVIISKHYLSPPPSPAFQLFSVALLGTKMPVCLL